MINKNKIKEYSEMYPDELKSLLEYMPKDDIDWALVIYLFMHTGKGNIITLGKISSYFGLRKRDTYERLNSMYWLVTQCVTYEYGDGIYTYEMSKFGEDVLLKLMELLEVKPKKLNRLVTGED